MFILFPFCLVCKVESKCKYVFRSLLRQVLRTVGSHFDCLSPLINLMANKVTPPINEIKNWCLIPSLLLYRRIRSASSNTRVIHTKGQPFDQERALAIQSTLRARQLGNPKLWPGPVTKGSVTEKLTVHEKLHVVYAVASCQTTINYERGLNFVCSKFKICGSKVDGNFTPGEARYIHL